MITTQKIFQSSNRLEQSGDYASIHTGLKGSCEVIVLNASEYTFIDMKDIDDFVVQLRQFMEEKEDRQNATFEKIMAGISI